MFNFVFDLECTPPDAAHAIGQDIDVSIGAELLSVAEQDTSLDVSLDSSNEMLLVEVDLDLSVQVIQVTLYG